MSARKRTPEKRPPRPTVEVTRLLEALGTPQFAAAAAAVRAGGAASATAFLRAFAAGVRLGRPETNGRAVVEDVESILVDLARADPELFLRQTRSVEPSVALLSALRVVDRPEATERLVAALDARSGAFRWLALETLTERGEPRAVARLGAFLRDRDSLVVFAAARALCRFGDASALPALEALAEAPRTAPGTRDAAREAIETITRRRATR